ncbi:MAG: hydroxymethylpyrimidine/phosphomethylpyrimidine kinase [Planctomycetes bacterium]|nr:hydroxymethylpyrimidine/phosphomethylpyrimidine kinase [Planctomycetota bacterium]
MADGTVLCLSGLDPSGSAGLLRDVWSVRRAGGNARAIATCLTAQTRERCTAVSPTPAAILQEQLEVILTDEPPAAIKIGLVADVPTWNVLVDTLEQQPPTPIVVDPVRALSVGGFAAADDVRDAILDRVCGLAPLLTPNRLELSWLGGEPEATAIAELLQRGASAVLVKGGHGAQDGDTIQDVLYQADAVHRFSRPRLGGARRGTGCALSAILALQVANGLDLPTAARVAGNMLWRAWDDLVPAENHG